MKVGIALLIIAAFLIWMMVFLVSIGLSSETPNLGAILVVVSFWSIAIIPCLIIGILRVKRQLKRKQTYEA